MSSNTSIYGLSSPQGILDQLMSEIQDRDEFNLDEINSHFLNDKRVLAIKAGKFAINHFNQLAEYMNIRHPMHHVAYIDSLTPPPRKTIDDKLSEQLLNFIFDNALKSSSSTAHQIDKAIQLAKKSGATHLDLSGFAFISGLQLKEAATIPSLRSIDMSGCQFEPSGLAHLINHTQLQCLVLK